MKKLECFSIRLKFTLKNYSDVLHINIRHHLALEPGRRYLQIRRVSDRRLLTGLPLLSNHPPQRLGEDATEGSESGQNGSDSATLVGLVAFSNPTDTKRNNDTKITSSLRQHDVGDVVLT